MDVQFCTTVDCTDQKGMKLKTFTLEEKNLTVKKKKKMKWRHIFNGNFSSTYLIQEVYDLKGTKGKQ